MTTRSLFVCCALTLTSLLTLVQPAAARVSRVSRAGRERARLSHALQEQRRETLSRNLERMGRTRQEQRDQRRATRRTLNRHLGGANR